MKRLVDLVAGTAEKRIAFALISLCAIVYIPLAGNYGSGIRGRPTTARSRARWRSATT